ncbi:MAG TPA: nucleotidyltransferase domain-containing protein [Longimicrobium sp.]|nr:nucleotidyltransferase domain-containing protein [Longimicrobium sp.]
MATSTLFSSAAFERLVLFYLVNPDAAPHLRDLQRQLRVGMRSLQAELARLEDRRLVRMERSRNRTVYRMNQSNAGWNALRMMVRNFGDPAEVVRVALATVPNVVAAFVFGSTARGEATGESDVDVLVVGDGIPRGELGRCAQESSAVIGRDVNIARYTPEEFAADLARGDPFLGRVMSGPRTWLAGDRQTLEALAG